MSRLTGGRKERGNDGRQRILATIRRKSPRAVRGDSVGNFGAGGCLNCTKFIRNHAKTSNSKIVLNMDSANAAMAIPNVIQARISEKSERRCRSY